ncbi:hypothetical protein [Mycobacteroides chelonae]|uniref:hypothetical protein n=1 Tax=Mycobacteroides chelonae TaxID=1774 RepID=UPI0008A9A40D|nr:hypothetical protein [Mycobacteroides chelonae]AYM43117.1 hypothetical protein DYE20_17665 [[Mycobacterium] chelonae subsp. gwanakae]OHU14474.1 hypothetical protein BKG75_04310 [Mycobacteroides chelonae]
MSTLIIAADQADKSSELMALLGFMLGTGAFGSILGIASYEVLANVAVAHSKYSRLIVLICYALALLAGVVGVIAGLASVWTGHFDGRTYLALGGSAFLGLGYAVDKYSSGQSDRHDLERRRILAAKNAERDADVVYREKLAIARKAEIQNEKEELALERAKLELELKRRELGPSELSVDPDPS